MNLLERIRLERKSHETAQRDTPNPRTLAGSNGPPTLPDNLPPAAPCPTCLCPAFWLAPNGSLHCLVCRRPPVRAMARRRLTVIATTNGPAWEDLDTSLTRPAGQPSTISNSPAASPGAGGDAAPADDLDGRSIDEWFESLPRGVGWPPGPWLRLDAWNRQVFVSAWTDNPPDLSLVRNVDPWTKSVLEEAAERRLERQRKDVAAKKRKSAPKKGGSSGKLLDHSGRQGDEG